MNPAEVIVGSLWLDKAAEALVMQLPGAVALCWYIDKSPQRHGKIFFMSTDDTFWRIQRYERFERIA